MIWYVVIAVTVLLFIALHVFVLPRRFLLCKYSTRIEDRGVKNINERGGHSIIYTPALRYRKHLKHYVISQRNKQVQLVCDFAEGIEYADFNVLLYDGNGEVFKTLQIQQAVENGESEPIPLPDETAYVSVQLNNVDGKTFSGQRVEGVKGGSLAKFLLICSFLELVVFFIVKIGVAKLYGGLFAESFIQSLEGNLITLAVGIVLVLINDLLTLIMIKSRNSKQTKRK